MKINKLLRKYREENGYTQQQIAELFNVTRECITKYENGYRSSLRIFILYLKFILTDDQILDLIEVIRKDGGFEIE